MASSSIIAVQEDWLFDLNGRKGKRLIGLFDNNLTTRINLSGQDDYDYTLPYSAFVVLDKIYNNFRIDYYDYSGNGTTMTVKLYSSTKSLLGTFTMTTEGFMVWKTIPGTDGFSNVRFVEVSASNSGDMDSGIYEIKLYGDIVSDAPSIYPNVSILPKVDPGKYAHGVNILDDRFTRQDINGNNIFLKVARSARVGHEATVWDYYPNHYTNPGDGLFWLGRKGTNALYTRIFNLTAPNNIKVQFYKLSGSIKDIDEATASNNTAYLPQANNVFRIPTGADKETPGAWVYNKEIYYRMVALWGSNTSADMTGITVTGGNGSPGQNVVHTFEVGNEENKDWLGPVSYLTPKAWYEQIKAVYNRAKQADANAQVFCGAITYLDITYLRAVYFHHYWQNGPDAVFPCDGFNMNIYLNSALDGQGGGPEEVAFTPEAWNLRNRIIELKALCDKILPNKKFHWSEFGVATDDGSPWDVNPVGSLTDRQTAAVVALRIKAESQTVAFADRMYYYAYFRDFSYPFDSMALTADVYNEEVGNEFYIRTDVYPMAFALANELAMEENYNFYSEKLTDGGTSGVHVTKKSHSTDATKKLFKVWKGSLNGSTVSNHVLNVGPDAVSAQLFTVRWDQYTPAATALSISGETVTVPVVEELMRWVEVTYAASPGSPEVDPSSICCNGIGINVNYH